ncbi:MAG TPA: DUF4384 domain-containing protein [Gemmatimonadales bacterium]|nr:DUF4384 domain-containing protein [Gemmatimonadales bacterium]
MITALLLPLLLSGTPAQPAATGDDPPIRIWISNDRRFLAGDRAKVQVRTEYDGYLIVLHVDPEGRVRVLFPLDPDKDNFVRGDKKYEVRGRGGREAFEADATGRGTVYAAVSRDPLRFDGFTLGDHWDYQALAPARLREDPEPELNELVHRMAQSTFDYDLLNYDVVGRSAYASSYPTRYYGSVYNDDWCNFSCGSYYGNSGYGLSVGLFYGHPYRRHYYNPYFYGYDPFYSPFIYDPYYYASSYNPSSYYPRYGYPYRYYGYPDRYYPDRDRVYNRPYTPYRFRGSEGVEAGFRDRGYDIRRSVNTVYNPPVSRVREPATSTPVRRITEGPAADLPAGVAPRRAVGHEARVNTEPVEARRAHEPEATRRAEPGEGRKAPEREAAPARRASEPREDRPREQPRAERVREEPRPVERAPAREARPERREVDRSSSPPPQDRTSGRAQSRGSGGGSDGGARRAGEGGARRR